VYHYRDSRPGLFYRNDDRFLGSAPAPCEGPPFLRFAHKNGVALDLWRGDGATGEDLLGAARLAWPVIRSEVFVPAGPGVPEATQAQHYRALVRPDTGQIMSVVTTAYSVAENRWVAEAVEAYARRIENRPPMVAAVGFGRDGERTLFAARVTGDENKALCLLGYNTHGGEGAVRLQLVEADRRAGAVYVLDSSHASASFPHIGDLEDRLARRPRSDETFIERYLAETEPLWERLESTLWIRRDTAALIRALWGETPDPVVGAPGGPQGTDPVAARHPGRHLPSLMEDITSAASAYRAICDWIDNHSEACERGDFTKDRDERLALGAGNKYKERAWRWIVDNI
jgi:hypothetical protein